MAEKGNVIEIKSKCVRLCFRFIQDLVHSKNLEGIHY